MLGRDEIALEKGNPETWPGPRYFLELWEFNPKQNRPKSQLLGEAAGHAKGVGVHLPKFGPGLIVSPE